jgi:hypothetical protein
VLVVVLPEQRCARFGLHNHETKNDYLGNPSFRVAYFIVRSIKLDWTGYSISQLVYFGEGNEATAEIESEFHAENATLVVQVHQQFKSESDARCLTLTFKWNGNAFELLKDG